MFLVFGIGAVFLWLFLVFAIALPIIVITEIVWVIRTIWAGKTGKPGPPVGYQGKNRRY